MPDDTTLETRQRIKAVGSVSSKILGGECGNSHKADADTSVIDSLYQQGSARIRFPNKLKGPLEAVMLNTAGGLTGNDDIHWKGEALSQSHLCITNAACEKVYRTHGPAAYQNSELKAGSGARLEWLPQETILFNQANLNRSLHVELESDAQALIVESLVFGRHAMNEVADNIVVKDRWRVYRNQQILHAEDLHIDTRTNPNLHSSSQLHHFGAISTLLLVGPWPQEWLDKMATTLKSIKFGARVKIGISVLPSRLIVRLVAKDSFQLRKILIPYVETINGGRAVPTIWKV